MSSVPSARYFFLRRSSISLRMPSAIDWGTVRYSKGSIVDATALAETAQDLGVLEHLCQRDVTVDAHGISVAALGAVHLPTALAQAAEHVTEV